jgi:predicted CoA-substrate-specific enzyme activase
MRVRKVKIENRETLSKEIQGKDTKLKWNFAMGLIHGTFFTGGQAFGNPNTILPIFLNNFTNSKVLIGFSSTIMGSLGGIGSVLPQLFVASKLEISGFTARHYVSDIQTIIEIGGQDSKIIILREGAVVDFAMNSICAAGCGAFLDHQSHRLKIPIEEFGDYALRSKNPSSIAGRCTVFAESDMIHKQQTGHKTEDIVYGLCKAIVRNYLNNVGKGKEIKPPIMFQGGVAANKGVRKALGEELGTEVIVPEHYHVMGAIGSALLAKKKFWNR